MNLVSPEHQQDQTLSFEQTGNSVAFTVPKVNVYEIAIVNVQ